MLRTIVESIADSVIVVTADGIIRYVNPAAEALFRRADRGLVGEPFAHPLKDSDIELPGAGDTSLTGEMRVVATEWEGQPAHVAIIRDITARQRLFLSERDLRVADRRSAIGHLAVNIAHEINNPTAFILANLSVMKDIAADFERLFKEARLSSALLDKYQIGQCLDDLREMLADNELGLSRIRSFVRELKGLSHDSPAVIEMVDLNQVITTACAMSQPCPGVELCTSLGDIPAIAGDRRKLTQLIWHLIDNAIHAVHDSERQTGLVELTSAVAGESVVVTVCDDGCGIPAEHIERIFEPFFIANPGKSGIGFGLPIALDIAGSHHGRIEVASQGNSGSSFRLTVPIETGLMLSDPRTSAAPGQVRARVLLVADDPSTGKHVGEYLGAMHDVIDPGSSQRALTHIGSDRDFDVVLCDASTLDGDVRALHAALSRQAPELATRMVFICSAASSRTKSFLESTRAMILEKPLSRMLLREVIERMSR